MEGQSTFTGRTGKHSYTYVKNDPSHTHIYTLSNGFKVYLSVNRLEPRVQTYIAVRAGSKTDPSYNTGLAHYLEHLLFKGTENFGTIGYDLERPYLDQIETLYSQYNKTKDPTIRKNIYKQIDSISGLAAKFAIANEYDRMMQTLGAKNTNAFTSFEQTVYTNDVPSDKLESWMRIEAERFSSPIFRIFHTELEAVYEEKNISLDNDDSKAYEKTLKNLFPAHPYGTQTTIGTAEHLKNPSLEEIRKYFNNYYCSNNMSLIMVGDFDEAQTIEWADQYFSRLKSNPVLPQTSLPKDQFGFVNSQTTCYGPNPSFVSLGYRFPGAGTREASILKLLSRIIYNGKNGLADKLLIKSQKVNSFQMYTDILNDYSYIYVRIQPKAQLLEQTIPPLIQTVIDRVLKGDFEDKMIESVINNFKADWIRKLSDRESTADEILDAFTTGVSWDDYIAELALMKTITKTEITEFARKYMLLPVSIVYKLQGEDTTVVKVEKPEITPVDVEANRNVLSSFAKSALSMTYIPTEPQFVDFNSSIKKGKLKNKTPLFYIKNNQNELFTYTIQINTGKNNNRYISYALQYLKLIGTKDMPNDKIMDEFFSLASNFEFREGAEKTYITISGLQENFEKTLTLLYQWIRNAAANEETLNEFKSQILKNRDNDKQNKKIILFSALKNYALHGPINPFTHTITNQELETLSGNVLTDVIHSFINQSHQIIYYGPLSTKKCISIVNNIYKNEPEVPAREVKPVTYPPQSMTPRPTIYFVDYDMVQAEVIWVRNRNEYSTDLTSSLTAFQEYYGGGMGSIVFQTIRESKALAYSCGLSIGTPERLGQNYIITAYLGTQADKLGEAMEAMNELLTNMPVSDELVNSSLNSIRSRLATERLNGMQLYYTYDRYKSLGINYDIRKKVYEDMRDMNFEKIRSFFQTQVALADYTICIVGSRKSIKPEVLSKFGDVKELTLSEIFNY